MADAYQFCLTISFGSPQLCECRPAIRMPSNSNRKGSEINQSMKITYVPSHSLSPVSKGSLARRRAMKTHESKSIVDITGAELRNGTWQWKPSSHLTQTLHHGVDRNTREGVTQQNGKRTRGCESTSNTQEQTCSDGSTKGDELNVSRLEAVSL